MEIPAERRPRPRVEGSRELEIFEVTTRLLVESGYDKLTMDAIASAARASKATLYRRWSGKAALVIDSVNHHTQFSHDTPTDSGNLREDLLTDAFSKGGLSDMGPMIIFSAVLPALHRDPELFRAFHERLIEPKITEATAVFERGRERGEVGAGADLRMLASILPAICVHQHFVWGQTVTRERIEQITDTVVLPACAATLSESVSPRTTRH
jgi:AcrR family transcriptional regulator